MPTTKYVPTQDWSGHVSMSTQQLAFFAMADKKANRIMRLREGGHIIDKKRRNPMCAERTPRGADYKRFDFSIPDGPKDLKAWDRWEYPDHDNGLMGKLNSQQNKMIAYLKKESDYDQELSEFKTRMAIKKEENDRQNRADDVLLVDALNKAKAKAALNTGRGGGDSSRSSARQEFNDSSNFARTLSGRLEGGGAGSSTSRDRQSISSFVASQPTSIDELPVSGFKTLGASHPEVLAKWRAQRAAEFVSTQKVKTIIFFMIS